MINEKDLQNMTKAEINKLQKMINKENKKRNKLQKSLINLYTKQVIYV